MTDDGALKRQVNKLRGQLAVARADLEVERHRTRMAQAEVHALRKQLWHVARGSSLKTSSSDDASAAA